MKNITVATALFLLVACGNSKKEKQGENPVVAVSTENTDSIEAEKYAERIELVHQKKVFEEKGMVEISMVLNFPEKEEMVQKVWMATASPLFRMDRNDGSSLFFENGNFFNVKNDSVSKTNYSGFAYLFKFPFHLSDPNKEWSNSTTKVFHKNWRAVKFEFAKVPAIFPSPWYVVYSDKRTDLLKAVAFADPNFNEGKPIAVVFENYITVKSVPVSPIWKIHPWSEETGIGEEILGSIKISEISFSPFEERVFEKGE